jgi:hypothetical protein
MTDFWIVSSHEFKQHETPESALAEAARLAKHAGHAFHVYRVGEKIGPGVAPECVTTGTDSAHAFVRGRHTRGACAVCGRPKSDPIHKRSG